MTRKRYKQDVQRHSSDRLFRTGVRVFYVLVIVISVVAGMDWLLREGAFPVKNIRMEGEFRHVRQDELAKAIMPAVQGNIFALDLAEVRTRAENLPWIQQATVRRRWPHDIYIRFTEHRLVARWGKSAWLNQVADVVEIESVQDGRNLPYLFGPKELAPRIFKRFMALNQTLQTTGLRVAALEMTPRGSWLATLDNDVVLVMSKKAGLAEAARFARSYPYLRPGKRRISRIDMRYTNGFSVKWKRYPRVASSSWKEG